MQFNKPCEVLVCTVKDRISCKYILNNGSPSKKVTIASAILDHSGLVRLYLHKPILARSKEEAIKAKPSENVIVGGFHEFNDFSSANEKVKRLVIENMELIVFMKAKIETRKK
jgi:hypothetical protein